MFTGKRQCAPTSGCSISSIALWADIPTGEYWQQNGARGWCPTLCLNPSNSPWVCIRVPLGGFFATAHSRTPFRLSWLCDRSSERPKHPEMQMYTTSRNFVRCSYSTPVAMLLEYDSTNIADFTLGMQRIGCIFYRKQHAIIDKVSGNSVQLHMFLCNGFDF